MNAQYINPFVTSALSVMASVLGEPPKMGALTAQPSSFTMHRCNIVLGVTGQVQGSVMLGMTMGTTLQVASAMLGQPVKMLDALAGSAVAELGNMICGNALVVLAEMGYTCDITPPTIILGEAKICTLTTPALVVPIETKYGQIYLTVGLHHKK